MVGQTLRPVDVCVDLWTCVLASSALSGVKNVIVDLDGSKLKSFEATMATMASTSRWRCSKSATSTAEWLIEKSSAQDGWLTGHLLTKKLKRMGPSTEPWGTPIFTLCQGDDTPCQIVWH